jgi:hypothetical protein
LSAFSAIDLQTRLEVQDLLSRFCHALDHNAVDRWAKLFTTDGYIDAPRLGCFKGREEIIKIPEMVHELGGGAWRHYLNNVYIERAEDNRDLKVEAYCMVSDWRKAGHVVRCWDFSAVVGKRNGLKFVSLLLKPVLDCNEAIAIKEPEPSIVG